jgi:hypothetical protein
MFARRRRLALILISTALLTLGVGLNMAVAVDPPAADAPTAKAILGKVAEAYKSISTYRSHGTTSAEVQMAGQTITDKGEFTMVLEKPDHYRISWTKSNSIAPTQKQSGAVWHDGTDRNLFVETGPKNGYVKQTEDKAALDAAAGLSGGVAVSVPSLFFEKFKGRNNPAASIKEPKLEGTEKVEGVDCYVVSGPSRESKQETLWIAKDSHLLVKYARSLEQPDGNMELTDDEVADILKQRGEEPTDENKAKIREMANKMRAFIRQMNIKGTISETHVDVASPKLKKEDFKYDMPKETPAKSSLKEVVGGGAGMF